MKQNALAADLDFIFSKTAPFWEELRNQNLFITGGTGFFGCWLLESFLWANKKLNLNAKAWVLTRNSFKFLNKYPHFSAEDALIFLEGDVRDFSYPSKRFSHLIHAATDVDLRLYREEPLTIFETIIQGTKRIFEFAKHGQVKKILLVSSGAVYGPQGSAIEKLSESHPSSNNLMEAKATYALGKSTAEHLAYLYAKQYQLSIKIARCFSFIGPYLALDGHFAIGNFIANALKGEAIQITGSGTEIRSYLYTADLAVWLWTILFCGKSSYPYNVGSDESYTIFDLAKLVANSVEQPVTVLLKGLSEANNGLSSNRYVPNIERVHQDFNLRPEVKLIDAIHRTKNWYLNLTR